MYLNMGENMVANGEHEKISIGRVLVSVSTPLFFIFYTSPLALRVISVIIRSRREVRKWSTTFCDDGIKSNKLSVRIKPKTAWLRSPVMIIVFPMSRNISKMRKAYR